MDDALRRAGWISILVIAVAYVTFVASNNAFNADTATTTPIVVRDILGKDEHHLYGKILVPSSCDEVSVKTENVGNNQYQLVFQTWAEPEVTCIQAPAERVFDTVIFAPSIGVEFSATLDKIPVPLAVYPIITNQ